MSLRLTEKQNQFIREAKSRWNIKVGAVRSGKSFEDTAFEIPYHVRKRHGLGGINVILGVSKSTIERNVLQPMREIYTEALVGNINSHNVVRICGEDVYCLGAEKISQVAKIQGASIKYCYGDEIAKWNKEVFEMLKSRLDKSYSRFAGSCNPESPTHWLKSFIDDPKLDKYVQHYTIEDNPFLPSEFVENLKKEYQGTIYYDRYILGLWKRAEGVIFKKIADEPKNYIRNEIPQEIMKIDIGIDFGGNGSYHTFVATAKGRRFQYACVLDSERHDGLIDPSELEKKFVTFIEKINNLYLRYADLKTLNVYCDSAEQVLIRGFKKTVQERRLNVIIHNARKMEIRQRIELITRLCGLNKFFFYINAQTALKAYQTAVYDSREGHEDERLDNGTSDIDTCDATEYSLEIDYKYFIANQTTQTRI